MSATWDPPPGNCPRCKQPLSTPLACLACHLPLDAKQGISSFGLVGVPARFDVDPDDLRKRVSVLAREVHPDFFATADPATRQIVERNSAWLFGAAAVLSNDIARANEIVERLGGPSESDERSMPQEFLMEVLEWNETLEEARESGAPRTAELSALETELRERRKQAMANVATLLAPLPPRGDPELRKVRQELNAVRYVDRALQEIGSLRLQQSARR